MTISETSQDFVRLSKSMSYALRHNPQSAGVTLDSQGWAEIDALIQGIPGLDRDAITHIIESSAKARFIISPDGQKIKAAHGHSVPIDVEGLLATPPDTLYHGTAVQDVDSIMQFGLHAGGRLFVHLTTDQETALSVGGRHGSPVLLTIRSGEMHSEHGIEFFLSETGVWLTKEVAPHFITANPA